MSSSRTNGLEVRARCSETRARHAEEARIWTSAAARVASQGPDHTARVRNRAISCPIAVFRQGLAFDILALNVGVRTWTASTD